MAAFFRKPLRLHLALAPGGGKKAGKKTATDSFVALQM